MTDVDKNDQNSLNQCLDNNNTLTRKSGSARRALRPSETGNTWIASKSSSTCRSRRSSPTSWTRTSNEALWPGLTGRTSKSERSWNENQQLYATPNINPPFYWRDLLKIFPGQFTRISLTIVCSESAIQSWWLLLTKSWTFHLTAMNPCSQCCSGNMPAWQGFKDRILSWATACSLLKPLWYTSRAAILNCSD